MDSKVILLGPQKYERTVATVADELFPTGPVATVTAGWQEWEVEDRSLDADLGGRSVNLSLYNRAESIFDEDRELREGHRVLQQRIRLLQRAYRRRVDHAYRAWQAVDKLMGDEAVLGPERDAAFQAIRAVDDRHLERVGELRADFEAAFAPSARPTVARHRQEVLEALEPCAAVVVEGGHVPVLLNRLRMLDLGPELGKRVVVACSGGAMALAPRVVLFDDGSFQSRFRPEVADVGLGLFHGVIPLPDASQRLELGDADRVGRFARRFAPDTCVTLDGGQRVDWTGDGWIPRGAGHLGAGGGVETWKARS